MTYNQYNFFCLITSILFFIIIVSKYNYIDFYIVLLLASIFSIIWRSIKLYRGQNIIEKDENLITNYKKSNSNPFFLFDFCFAILAYICIFYSNQVNRKFVILTFLFFIIAWFINISDVKNNNSQLKTISEIIHSCGHFYVVLIMFITFYLNIH